MQRVTAAPTAGSITDTSLGGNLEIVFETDFATNYNVTTNAWETNFTDTIGTLAGGEIAVGAFASEAITADAPAVIARFGSGNVRIEVREIVPGGAAAYFSSLSKDIQDRRASGISLLENPRITVSAAARGQLRAGQVDSRLLVVIAGLAARRFRKQ